MNELCVHTDVTKVVYFGNPRSKVIGLADNYFLFLCFIYKSIKMFYKSDINLIYKSNKSYKITLQVINYALTKYNL